MTLELLERSSATETFRDAVRRLAQGGRPSEHVSFNRLCPPIKVERAVAKALEEYPHLEIESIHVDGTSGCEFFRGVMEIRTALETRRVRFDWDCRWRAEQEGWVDWFGFPDQSRAAREFGHDCFRAWREESVAFRPAAVGETEQAGEPVPA